MDGPLEIPCRNKCSPMLTFLERQGRAERYLAHLNWFRLLLGVSRGSLYRANPTSERDLNVHSIVMAVQAN